MGAANDPVKALPLSLPSSLDMLYVGVAVGTGESAGRGCSTSTVFVAAGIHWTEFAVRRTSVAVVR